MDNDREQLEYVENNNKKKSLKTFLDKNEIKNEKTHNNAEFFYIKKKKLCFMTAPSLLPKINFFDKSITTALN